MRKFLAAFCCTLLCASLCACMPVQPKDDPPLPFNPEVAPHAPVLGVEKMSALNLPCTEDLWQNSPFSPTGRANRDAFSLLYDPLFELSPSYEAIPYLATSVQNSGTLWTVNLRQDVFFWDGTPLQAEQVQASLTLAMQSSLYGAPLRAAVKSCTITDPFTLLFETFTPDVNFPALLTFPIALRTEEGFAGTGRYRPTQPLAWTLSQNTAHFSPPSSIKTVTLHPLKDIHTLETALRSNTIHCYVTDSSLQSVSNGLGNKIPLDTNELVFLGMNSTKGLLQDGKLRHAVLQAVSQGDAIRPAYNANAIPVTFPFNPAFFRLTGTQLPTTYNPQDAAALLDELGYPLADSGGGRLLPDGTPLTLRLAVNTESEARVQTAQNIAVQLEQVGISVTIEKYAFAVYLEKLQKSDFDLYVGEVGIPTNMSLSSMLTPSALCGFGTLANNPLQQAHTELMAGTLSYADFITAFYDVIPFVPLAYRNNLLVYSAGFSGDVIPTDEDVFYNLAEW